MSIQDATDCMFTWKKWTLKFKLLYLLKRICYFNKICRIYVDWILICKLCTFGKYICYNFRDIKCFLGDYFFWLALYIGCQFTFCSRTHRLATIHNVIDRQPTDRRTQHCSIGLSATVRSANIGKQMLWILHFGARTARPNGRQYKKFWLSSERAVETGDQNSSRLNGPRLNG